MTVVCAGSNHGSPNNGAVENSVRAAHIGGNFEVYR
jgi:hypothetical protein